MISFCSLDWPCTSRTFSTGIYRQNSYPAPFKVYVMTIFYMYPQIVFSSLLTLLLSFFDIKNISKSKLVRQLIGLGLLLPSKKIQNPSGGKREQIPKSCPLTALCSVTCMSTCTHTNKQCMYVFYFQEYSYKKKKKKDLALALSRRKIAFHYAFQ